MEQKPKEKTEEEVLEMVNQMIWTDCARLTCMPRLIEIIRESENESAVVKAIGMIFDRAYGKPKEELALTGRDGGPLQIAVDAEQVSRFVKRYGKGGA